MTLACPAALCLRFSRRNGQPETIMLSYSLGGRIARGRPICGIRIGEGPESTWSGWHGSWYMDTMSQEPVLHMFVHWRANPKRLVHMALRDLDRDMELPMLVRMWPMIANEVNAYEVRVAVRTRLMTQRQLRDGPPVTFPHRLPIDNIASQWVLL